MVTRADSDSSSTITDEYGRSAERIRHHYDVEIELADRLRTAPREARSTLYGEVYDELYQRVPDHPQLLEAQDPSIRARRVAAKRELVGRFLGPNTRFMEIGSGDGAFIAAVADEVATATAVDVSEEVVAAGADAANVTTVLSDGVSIPVDPGSIDVVFSDQLMEHLHPDDARDQLTNIATAVAPGGWYVCCTPHRLSGPHDVSRFYSDQAEGFHLHEYDYAELIELMRSAGFTRFRVFAGGRGKYVEVPLQVGLFVERIVDRLPAKLRRRVGRFLPIRAALGISVAAGR